MKNLIFEFSRVTEQGALAAYKYLGRNNKNLADQASVKAMRYLLNNMDMAGEIIIGEGEMDEAPMLYIGEKVGKGNNPVDIAVDPIDGTLMVASGQYNAMSVIAASEKGCLLQAPDMYMEKLVVREDAKGVIDLDLPLEVNIKKVAKALNKELSDMCITIQNRPRHSEAIDSMRKLGCKIFAFENGDISTAIETCIEDSDIDMMYSIGGAPEGVIAACAIKALGGDMNARLVSYDKLYEDCEETRKFADSERVRCQQMGVEINKKLILEDLVKGDNILFSATGITNGDLLKGVRRNGNVAKTDTLLIRGKTHTVRRIQSTHYLNYKDDEIKDVVL